MAETKRERERETISGCSQKKKKKKKKKKRAGGRPGGVGTRPVRA